MGPDRTFPARVHQAPAQIVIFSSDRAHRRAQKRRRDAARTDENSKLALLQIEPCAFAALNRATTAQPRGGPRLEVSASARADAYAAQPIQRSGRLQRRANV